MLAACYQFANGGGVRHQPLCHRNCRDNLDGSTQVQLLGFIGKL